MVFELNYFTFVIDNHHFAISLNDVWRVIRAQEVKPVPEPPPFITGLIDYYGEIIPVINLRKRLGFPGKEIAVSDRFILVRSKNIHVALVADEVSGHVKPDKNEIIESVDINSGLKFVRILKQEQELVLIYDLDELLSSLEDIDLIALLDYQESERADSE